MYPEISKDIPNLFPHWGCAMKLSSLLQENTMSIVNKANVGIEIWDQAYMCKAKPILKAKSAKVHPE